MLLRRTRALLTTFCVFIVACGNDAKPGAGPGSAGQSSSAAGQSSSAAGRDPGPASAGSSGSGGGSAGEISGGGSGGKAEGAAGAGSGTGAGGAGTSGAGGNPGSGGAIGNIPDGATVVIFVVDGLQTAALQTAMANGATNMKFLVDGGVTAEAMYTTSPAARAQLPDGSLPWGSATSGNMAMQTGCHLFESNEMDDIFLAAGRAQIKSVFAGGDPNYSVFVSPDFEVAAAIADAGVVQFAIDHLNNDGARLLRLHLQRIRDFWDGPASQTTADSPYIGHLLEVDGLLGDLRAALVAKGVWEKTYVILTSDHGMNTGSNSDHPPSALSSWKNVLVVYGPGVKQQATIPYAELPDVAVLTNHLLKLPKLAGYTEPPATLTRTQATGTLLSNVFEGQPAELQHPQYIETYLNSGTYTGSGTSYADYRSGMLELLK